MKNTNEIEILLVEDNETDAELTMRALKKHHLTNKLVWVKDGEEALDLIFNGETDAQIKLVSLPRLILLDLRLPKIDGFEVLRRLKSDKRTKAIPVVILTSSTEDKDIITSYNLGVNSFISKPVAFEEFVSSVSELGLYWLLLNKKLPE